MAPFNQLSVLAFASAALAVPHFEPFKRHAHAHAHASAPPTYGDSSAPPAYGTSSSSAGAVGSSASPVQSSGIPVYGGSSAGAVSSSGATASSGYAGPSGGYGYGSGSSSSGYASQTGAYSTGAYSTGYSLRPTGYSGTVSYSTCTETSTLIYRSSTAYSTYYVTHTITGGYPTGSASASSVGAISSAAGGYSGAVSPAASSESVCIPDVTVTTTEKTTVYVTVGASASSEAGASGAQSYPATWETTATSAVASSPASPAASSPPAYSSPAASSAPAYSSPAASSPASSPATYSSPAATPSSYSAPTPSATAPSGGSGASGYSGKRGLAYNDASLVNMFTSSSYVGWAYNWIPTNGGLTSDIPYIPCLHDGSSAFTDTWDSVAQAAISSGSKWLFSFNEPDMSSQANLSPAAAASLWQQYMEPYAGKIGLVAPAVTNGQGTGIGADWMSQFLEACSSCTIDAVAQHWYWDSNDVEEFKSQIQAASTATGKPVWVNEFGAVGSDEEKSQFLEQVMPWMDSNDDILGYSYFMVSDGLLVNGNAPSSYGQTYADYS